VKDPSLTKLVVTKLKDVKDRDIQSLLKPYLAN
jgi:hypothetical protein